MAQRIQALTELLGFRVEQIMPHTQTVATVLVVVKAQVNEHFEVQQEGRQLIVKVV
jgi:hypothetical protein